ncbi:hypothetical protein D3C80_1509430 [compost metagenome]
MRTQRPARHHHFKTRIFIENMRHPQTVSDNAQMVVIQQGARHMFHRGTNGDENRRTIRDVISNGFGDCPFLLRQRDFTLFKRRIHHTRRTPRAAVMARNQSLLAELANITPHRLR